MKYSESWDLTSIPFDLLQAAAARQRRALQAPPTAEKLKACEHCGEQFGVRRLRRHAPSCRKAMAASIMRQGAQGRSEQSQAPLGCQLANQPPLRAQNAVEAAEKQTLAPLIYEVVVTEMAEAGHQQRGAFELSEQYSVKNQKFEILNEQWDPQVGSNKYEL